MELIKLDSNFQPKQVLENYSSLVWTERYSQNGDFQITSSDISGMLQLLPRGACISLRESTVPMVVEDYKIDKKFQKAPEITITGRSFETVLERRVSANKLPRYYGNSEEASKRVPWEIEAVSPSDVAFQVMRTVLGDPVTHLLDGHALKAVDAPALSPNDAIPEITLTLPADYGELLEEWDPEKEYETGDSVQWKHIGYVAKPADVRPPDASDDWDQATVVDWDVNTNYYVADNLDRVVKHAGKYYIPSVDWLVTPDVRTDIWYLVGPTQPGDPYAWWGADRSWSSTDVAIYNGNNYMATSDIFLHSPPYSYPEYLYWDELTPELWVGGKEYNQGALVTYYMPGVPNPNPLYLAQNNVAQSALLASAKPSASSSWKAIPTPAWDVNTNYYVADNLDRVVEYDGIYFIPTEDDIVTPDLRSDLWYHMGPTQPSDPYAWWSGANSYLAMDVVIYNGNNYYAVDDIPANTPPPYYSGPVWVESTLVPWVWNTPYYGQGSIVKYTDPDGDPSGELIYMAQVHILPETPAYRTDLWEKTKYEIPLNYLYTTVMELISINRHGLKAVRPAVGGNKIGIEIYNGADLTETVRFDVRLDQIDDSSYLLSERGSTNVAYVFGPEGSVPVNKTQTEPAGLARRVLLVDVQSEDGLLPAEYMRKRGLLELYKYNATALFDGSLADTMITGYNINYHLGDIVTLNGEYGLSRKVRVEEFIRSIDASGFKAYPTFSAVDE